MNPWLIGGGALLGLLLLARLRGQVVSVSSPVPEWPPVPGLPPVAPSPVPSLAPAAGSFRGWIVITGSSTDEMRRRFSGCSFVAQGTAGTYSMPVVDDGSLFFHAILAPGHYNLTTSCPYGFTPALIAQMNAGFDIVAGQETSLELRIETLDTTRRGSLVGQLSFSGPEAATAFSTLRASGSRVNLSWETQETGTPDYWAEFDSFGQFSVPEMIAGSYVIGLYPGPGAWPGISELRRQRIEIRDGHQTGFAFTVETACSNALQSGQIVDYAAFQSHYGTVDPVRFPAMTPGSRSYDPAYDFNCDGVIDSVDFSLLSTAVSQGLVVLVHA